MKNFLLLNICILCSWLYAAPSHAAVWWIDDFLTPEGLNQNTVVSIGTGPTVSTNVSGIANTSTIGGNRYYEVDRIVPGGNSGESVRAETENIFGFSTFRYFSSDDARGEGMLSYGHDTSLNADFDGNGVIFGFRLSGFSADASALSGDTATMTLTIYSDTGTGSVTKMFSDLVGDDGAQWLNTEFLGDNVNFFNVSRIDLSWGNFSAHGADFSFDSFDTLNWLPESSTTSMLMVAAALIFLLRRSRNSTWISAR
jgi:hypothetical protein